MSVRTLKACSPVAATPRGAGTPSPMRASVAMHRGLRLGSPPRRSDRSDYPGSDQISTAVRTCASHDIGPYESLPVYYVDHQYHGHASVSHPLSPFQNLPVTIVAGSSAVYPTAQHSYLIPVRSSSVDPMRSDHVLIGVT